MWFVKIIILFLVWESISSLHPILLVPGDGGSHLQGQYIKPPPHYLCGRQDRSFLLWLNLYFMLPITIDCFSQSIKLEYNKTTRRTSNPDFVNITIPGFGSTDSISYLSNLRIKETSYFFYLIDELVSNQGYTVDKNIRGAPYDFRKSPREMDDFIYNFIKLIEIMYEDNLQKPVILIGHSLGTLYSHLVLTSMPQSWKDKYIKAFISASGPYSGALDALRTILSGNNEHVPIINPIKVRVAQSTWPSTYFLLPTAGLWPNKTIVRTNQGSYTTNTIIDLLALSQIPNAVDHFKNTNTVPKSILPPNTTVFCIYADNLPTAEVLDYRFVDFFNDQPNITYGPGDGTVNLASLQQCSNWKNTQKQPVETKIIPNVAHLSIMRDTRFLQYVGDVIKNINSQ